VFFLQLCIIPLNLALFQTWVGWQNICHLQNILRCKDWLFDSFTIANLGPFDGLALGMGPAGINLASTRQSIDGWRWTGNIFPLGLSSLEDRLPHALKPDLNSVEVHPQVTHKMLRMKCVLVACYPYLASACVTLTSLWLMES